MEVLPPPMLQGPRAPQARSPYQLFCRYRSPLTHYPPDLAGYHGSGSDYFYLPVPPGEQLRDPTYMSLIWKATGHLPQDMELVACTPDGGEAVLKRYMDPLQCPDLPKEPHFGFLFPEVNPNNFPQGMTVTPRVAHSVETTPVIGLMPSGPSSNPNMSDSFQPPMYRGLVSSIPANSHRPMQPAQHSASYEVGQNAQPIQYRPASFMPQSKPPSHPRAVSQRQARNASKTHVRQASKKIPLTLALPLSGPNANGVSVGLSNQPLNTSNATSRSSSHQVTPGAAGTLISPVSISSTSVTYPAINGAVPDSQDEDGLSPAQEDVHPVSAIAPSDTTDEASVVDADDDTDADDDYEMRKWNRDALPWQVNRVLDAIKNNYSGDRGKHARRPVRIAIYNELKRLDIKGHFGPRGDLLGGSSLREYTLEQLGMTPKLWNHIDYKFGAGKVGKEMMTKEGGKTSRRIQHRVSLINRRKAIQGYGGGEHGDEWKDEKGRKRKMGMWGWENFANSSVTRLK